MKLWRSLFLGLLVLLQSSVVLAQETPPDKLVHDTAEDVLQILRTDEALRHGDKQRAYALVREKMLPVVNFRRTAQLTLGKYWRQASEEQREAFAEEFKTLLINTYAAALTQYKDEKVVYKPFSMKPEEKRVVVQTEVIRANGTKVPVDYYLERTSNGWRVYDVIVDGISLVINYRSAFSDIVEKKGVDGLIADLRNKNQRGETMEPNKTNNHQA
jgi:phospholipid transport system substrate-binding protein